MFVVHNKRFNINRPIKIIDDMLKDCCKSLEMEIACCEVENSKSVDRRMQVPHKLKLYKHVNFTTICFVYIPLEHYDLLQY